MGTTLTGTTPATTYDSLIKVTDNGPLSATAKYLSDGLGNDSALALSTGNVGIGNTIPSSFLSNGNQLVVGSGAAAQGITIYSDTAGTGNLFFADGTAGDTAYRGFLRYSHDSDSMQIYTAGANERMRITSTGAVGIGTSSPDNALEVAGAAGTTTSLVKLTNSSAAAPSNIAQVGFELANSYSGANTDIVFGAIKANSGNYDSDFYISTSSGTSSPAERMRITAGGNVGIGTASPTNLVMITKSSNSGSASSFPRLSVANTLATQGDGSSTFNFADINVSSGDGAVNMFVATTYAAGTWAPAAQLNVASNHPLVIKTAGTEVARFLAGGGLTFNGDTAAANALDDYEEGTWTLGVSFGGASVGVTASVNSGTYTKIGRQVTVNGYLILTSKGSSVGEANITGLPFTIGTGNGYYGAASLRLLDISFANQFQGVGLVNTTSVALQEVTEAGTLTSITDSDFQNTSRVIISLTYFV